MIISHKHKFIFVKCGKVAGTSLEIALRPHLGDEDIITPVVDHDERYAADHNIPGPKNYKNSDFYEKRVVNSASRGIFYEHAWAYEVRGLVGDDVWNNYYTFAIERDPREKSLSTYYHHRYGIRSSIPNLLVNTVLAYAPKMFNALRPPHPIISKTCSLSKWLDLDKEFGFSENWGRYTVDDKVVVDKVYSFDDLEIMVQELSGIMGKNIRMPRLKSGFRKKRKLTHSEEEKLEGLLSNPIYMKEFGILNN